MNILILNGSPKGQYSITLHTCLYLQRHFPEHHWTMLHVGQQIKALEKDFGPAIAAMKEADLLLFSYPVYTFMVPSQLHRFIELTKRAIRDGLLDLAGKWTTQVTTSKHFYDITAHRFIEENCIDMKLNVMHGLSADMDDLLTEKGRTEARSFFAHKLWEMERGSHLPLVGQLTAKPTEATLDGTTETQKDTSRKVVIVADYEASDPHLQLMIERFRRQLPYESEVVSLREYPFKGGCISCFNCSTDGKCIYADHFDDFLRNHIQKSDAIVYAFSIRDHSMGALFKMYDDRQFCNGHRTVTLGAPTGYLVSGNYSDEHNLQMVIEGRANVGGNYLCGVATDESDTDKHIDQLADTLAYALEHHYTQPSNFLGVGGMKIFRDLIYLMRGMMRADHRFFKSHGQYDFPQRQKATICKMYLVGWLMGSKKLKAKMGNKMNEGMIKPYREALDK